VRITGGNFRGRLIEPPAGFRARPTTDFAREGLMNLLNNRYDFFEVSLLDLFGVTGSISY
jgi:16S rRNA G966 N2-methylase RsmD